jgi:hypothetical protein
MLSGMRMRGIGFMQEGQTRPAVAGESAAHERFQESELLGINPFGDSDLLFYVRSAWFLTYK